MTTLGSGAIIGGFVPQYPISVDPSGPWTATPVPSEEPVPTTSTPNTVTAVTAGPTVMGGSSGMNDAVPSNGAVFSDLAAIGTAATPATAPAASSNFSWLIWAGVGLGVYFAFFR